ncbi:MAG: HipA N-terminal domain-containing protein [Mangrovibacterium sp.]
MRTGNVYFNKRLAGQLIEENSHSYIFRYDNDYFNDPTSHAISLTLPKSQQEYHSPHLFSFFVNMLSEGSNRDVQLRYYRIDEADDFGHLLATAGYDTIGAVTVTDSSTPSL